MTQGAKRTADQKILEVVAKGLDSPRVIRRELPLTVFGGVAVSGHHDPGDWPVLDVGSEVGALVVHLAAVPESGELEAQPAGDPCLRFHIGVHLRKVGGAPVPVALFPELTEGAYEILDDDLTPIAGVVVTGGSVAQLDLRAALLP